MFKRIVLSMIILIFASITLNAQDDSGGFVNDPAVNDDANACFTGGSMEGKCNQDTDGDGIASEAEVTWAWECGWYLIRYENGTFGSVPARCRILIPNPYNICFHDQYGSFALVGRPNTNDNVVFFGFSDYDCSGQAFPGGSSVVVTGSTFAEAFANCDALGNVVFLVRLQVLGYGDAPTDYWGCVAL